MLPPLLYPPYPPLKGGALVRKFFKMGGLCCVPRWGALLCPPLGGFAVSRNASPFKGRWREAPEGYSYFTAPSTMPLMICRWAIRKIMIMGIIASNAAVRIKSHCFT